MKNFFAILLGELSDHNDRKSHSYYVSVSVAKRFEKLCEKHASSPSRAIERFMERLIELDSPADK